MVVCLTWGCQAPAAALCAPVLGPPQPPQPPPPPVAPTTTFCSVIPIHPWKQSYGMEQVWQAEFQKLFSQYVPQSWYLLPVVQRPIGVNWQTFVDSAKVRFCCEVLVNIYNRVGQVYYGFQQPPIHKNRRPGKPRNPHNAELCQACKDGVCSERR
uniref:Putative receptor-transporting protein n=1 Tax=Amblyomma triste TaxID=251400 RepID=A0A023G539_AMBTT